MSLTSESIGFQDRSIILTEEEKPTYSFDFTWPDLYKLLYGKMGNDVFQPTHDELLEEFFANSLEANNFEIYRVISSLDSRVLIERMNKMKEARNKPKSVGRVKQAGN